MPSQAQGPGNGGLPVTEVLPLWRCGLGLGQHLGGFVICTVLQDRLLASC